MRGLLLFHDNLWFTGVSSNPLLSLAAHGVDLAEHKTYLCWVIPTQYAAELKAEALALDFFRHAWEDASDYIAPEQPYTYLYHYLVEKGRTPLIDTAGFTPLKYIPGRPVQIFWWDPTTRLLLRGTEGKILQCDFREGGYDLFFDARTSQSGYVYRYLPEEGQEGDWERLYGLLLYFLEKNGKQKGTKWRYVKKELASDNMRFVNGMIDEDSP